MSKSLGWSSSKSLGVGGSRFFFCFFFFCGTVDSFGNSGELGDRTGTVELARDFVP
jgi:hypothetical protein